MRAATWFGRWSYLWGAMRSGQTLTQRRCLAIDLELTGLDPRRDHIVSLGWVPIEGREIRPAQARYFLVRPPVSVGQSAIYHGVHDRDLQQAESLETALRALMDAAQDSLLVAHNSALERRFLGAACRQTFGHEPNWPFLDTLRLELAQLHRAGRTVGDDALTLDRCLARHRLPPLTSHHALEDAYGCALLLLAQTRPETRLASVLLQAG